VDGRNVAHIPRFKNITLRIHINSHVDKQFTVTTSGTGAIRKQTTTLSHINGHNPNRLCSHSNQQVHRWPNVEYDTAHGPPNDKQFSFQILNGSHCSPKGDKYVKSTIYVGPSNPIFNNVKWFVTIGKQTAELPEYTSEVI
jgi:hypothetical protein